MCLVAHQSSLALCLTGRRVCLRQFELVVLHSKKCWGASPMKKHVVAVILISTQLT